VWVLKEQARVWTYVVEGFVGQFNTRVARDRSLGQGGRFVMKS
jgi:hypothetical protein